MANITVSANVDTMLQSANNAAIISNIGATTLSEIEATARTFQDEVTCQDNLIVEGSCEFQGDAEFQGELLCEGSADFSSNTTFSGGSIDFQNDVQISNGGLELGDGDLEFTAGGGQSIILDGGVITGASSIEATSFFKANPITTTARDALSASNGMIIYNSTTNKFQGRANGAWVDLH